MKNLLNFLIELAHTSPHQPQLGELLRKQSQTVQTIFLNQNTHQIKKILSGNKNEYFANERTVVLLKN